VIFNLLKKKMIFTKFLRSVGPAGFLTWKRVANPGEKKKMK
jgi:hypothetical protein